MRKKSSRLAVPKLLPKLQFNFEQKFETIFRKWEDSKDYLLLATSKMRVSNLQLKKQVFALYSKFDFANFALDCVINISPSPQPRPKTPIVKTYYLRNNIYSVKKKIKKKKYHKGESHDVPK